jgi:transposase
MIGRSDSQSGFFGDFFYDQVLPADHLLRKLKELVAADRVNEACRNLYSDTGRPGWEPALLFRMLLLQHIHEISSRDIEEQVNLHLAFKWFVGLEANAKAPDATTLAAFRERLGPERFNELLGVILDKAREKRILLDKLFIVDADHIKLQGETYRVRKDAPKNGGTPGWAGSLLRRFAALFKKPEDPQPKLKL